MKHLFAALVIALLCGTSPVAANSRQVLVSAGDSSLSVDYNARKDIDAGYLRFGLGGFFEEDSNEEYQVLHGTLSVGSNSIADNLFCDLGFRALFGKVENGARDGTATALGFNIEGVYTLTELTVPVDLRGGITWAPEILAFSDLDSYFEYNAGIGFQVIPNGAIVLGYRHSSFDMENNWSVDGGMATIGLSIEF